MEFRIVDTEAIYRRLLDTPDAQTRAEIFRAELVEPFNGLAQVFGGDGMAAFASWGMSPEQFAESEKMGAVVDALAGADAWTRAVSALVRGRKAFVDYRDRIPTESITFGLVIAIANVPGSEGGGYTGFGAIPGWIMTSYNPSKEDYAQYIEPPTVEAATVHELHHNILGAVTPPKNFMTEVTVGDYMVMEGLAESFAAELYGERNIGPWAVGFDESRLEATKAIFRDGLNVTGFNNIRSYIFGDEIVGGMGTEKVGVPPFAGYALGYRVVQAYLQRCGKDVAAATFVPAQEIIEESGYLKV